MDLAQRATVRVIPTARTRSPILAPLVDDDAALLADLAALESVTNTRLQSETAGRPDLDPRELVHGRPSASFINAAFIYTRPGGNRFNDEGRGAWYCAFEAETALREVAFHLTRELEAVGRYDNATDYAELFADLMAPFHDLRSLEFASQRYLDADAVVAYPAGQTLARRLRLEARSNGVIYPSVRHASGTCLAAFHPYLVQNARQGGVWRMEWRGAPAPTITRREA